MVKNRVMNTVKMLIFLFVLTIVLVWLSPFLFAGLFVSFTMFFEPGFWTLFFIMTGAWFIFGMLLWMRGYGRKGETA